MTLYTMADAYESADFARRKPMSARVKQAISRALKGKIRSKKGSARNKKRAGMAVGAAAGLGALALGGRAIMKRRSAKISAKNAAKDESKFDEAIKAARAARAAYDAEDEL